MKLALKFTLVTLTLMILSLPFFYPDNPWSWPAIALMVLLDIATWSGGPDIDRRPPQR